jgi:hypothetical protein
MLSPRSAVPGEAFIIVASVWGIATGLAIVHDILRFASIFPSMVHLYRM